MIKAVGEFVCCERIESDSENLIQLEKLSDRFKVISKGSHVPEYIEKNAFYIANPYSVMTATINKKSIYLMHYKELSVLLTF